MDVPYLNLNYWILQTVAMMVTCLLIPKLKVDGPIPAFATVAALAFVNAHAWSAALFFKVPDSLTNQSLMLLVTNGVIFWIIVKVLPGIEVEGILAALVAPLVFTICSIAISKYGAQVDWLEVGKAVLEYIRKVKLYFESAPSPDPA